jgi:hypothetical protein
LLRCDALKIDVAILPRTDRASFQGPSGREERQARKMWPLYHGRGGEEEEIPLHRRPYADFIPTPTEEV